MPLICKKVTTFVVQNVLVAVDDWVVTQETRCKKLPKWNPLRWLCWLVTTVVKITVWVTREILVPVINTVCTFVSWIIWFFGTMVGLVVDAVCANCNAVAAIDQWFKIETKLTFLGRVEVPGTKLFIYTFKCTCKKDGKETEIQVEAANDHDAAQKAEEICAKLC